MSTANYYKVLGLKPKASIDEVKRAYRLLAREYHPDSHSGKSSEALFQEITEAYNVLSNETTKREYDQSHELYSDLHEKIAAYRENEKLKFGKSAESGKVSGSAERPSDGQKFEGPSGLRFGGRPIDTSAAQGKKKTLFGKVSERLERFSKSSEELVGKVSSTLRRPSSDGGTNPTLIREEREYRFSIDALESIQGTTRELAIEAEGGPRLIRVKIPAGVLPGASLKVNCPPRSGSGPIRQLQVRVFVEPHDLVERDGYDITVKMPITVQEAVDGGEIEVPTLEGPLRLRIPPGWDLTKRLRVKEKGLALPESNERGNLYVRTYIALPAPSEELSNAARSIERLYRSAPRLNLPSTLVKAES